MAKLAKSTNTEIDGLQVQKYDPHLLTKEQLIELGLELTPLTAQGFMRGEITQSLIDDVRDHVLVGDRLSVARLDSITVAFITATICHMFPGSSDDKILYHLEGIIVDTAYHGTGLATKMLKDELNDAGANYLGFHTQSRRMEGLGMKLAELNDLDAERYGSLIHTRNQVGKSDVGRYGDSSLYGDTRRFAEIALSEINWEHGDAKVCIGPIKRDILK